MRHGDKIALGAAIVLALGLRLWVATTPMCINTDGVFFIQLAQQLSEGGGYFHPTVAITPGYSLVLSWLGSDSFEQVALYLSVICGALGLVPAWFGWRLLFGAWPASLACLMVAAWPMSVQFGSGVFYEPLCLVLLMAGWYAWLHSLRGGHWALAIATGLCWAAVAWMKPEVLAWGGLGGLWLAWKRQWVPAVLLMGTVFVVYMPYVVMVHGQTGEWRIAAKQDVNALKAQAIGQEDYHSAVEQYRDEGQDETVAVPMPSLIDVAKRVIVNGLLVHRYAFPENWPPVLLVLAAIGFFVAWNEGKVGVWLLLPFVAVLPLLLFQIEARVWHPLFFVATGLCGVALGRLHGWSRWVALGVCLCLLVPQALRPAFRTHVDEAERRAGMWLWQHAAKDEVVLDRKPFVGYYAGLEQIWPPAQEGLDGLRRTLDQYPAVVMVVDNRYFRRSRRAWFEALQCPPDWLVERARFSGPDGHQVRLLSYRRPMQ